MHGLKFPGGEFMEPCLVAEKDSNMFLSIMCLIAIPIYLMGGLIVLFFSGLGKLMSSHRQPKNYSEWLSQNMRELSSSSAPLSTSIPPSPSVLSPSEAGEGQLKEGFAV